MEKYYNTKEASELLGLKEGTIRKLVREGKLNALRTGGTRQIMRIPESEINAYIKKNYK